MVDLPRMGDITLKIDSEMGDSNSLSSLLSMVVTATWTITLLASYLW